MFSCAVPATSERALRASVIEDVLADACASLDETTRLIWAHLRAVDGDALQPSPPRGRVESSVPTVRPPSTTPMAPIGRRLR